ncbi:MAG: lysine--tRNA ligase, partial [Phycisphaerae bacterium]
MAETSLWILQVADQVEAFATGRGKGQVGGQNIVCASGITPSGPVHLGNMREVMTVHLVCEELCRRGHRATHLHVWDDYDRFRKVPVGVDAAFAQHLGKPVCDVPDPFGEYA